MRGPIGLRDVPHLGQIISIGVFGASWSTFLCLGDVGDSCYQRIKNGTNKKNYSGV